MMSTTFACLTTKVRGNGACKFFVCSSWGKDGVQQWDTSLAGDRNKLELGEKRPEGRPKQNQAATRDAMAQKACG
jgi:hypothetical protein